VVWLLSALVAYIPITFRPYFWGEPPDDRMPLAVVLTVFVPAALATLWLYGVRGRLARRHNQSDDHRPEAASLAL